MADFTLGGGYLGDTPIGAADYTPPFPQVFAPPREQSVVTGIHASDGTSHSITLPPRVYVGQLLLVVTSWDGNPTITWDNSTFGSWTELLNTGDGTTATKLTVHGKVALGTEGGGTLAVTTNVSEQCAWISKTIADWEGSIANGILVAAANTGSSTAPNPPSNAPSWGTFDGLWIAAFGADDGTMLTSDFPPGYDLANLVVATATSTGARVSIACRQQTVSSSDPGLFATGNEQWVATTIAIRAGGQGLFHEVTASDIKGGANYRYLMRRRRFERVKRLRRNSVALLQPQLSALVPAALTHAQSLANAPLAEHAVITPAVLTHSHGLADAVIVQAGVLVPAALGHSHALDATTVVPATAAIANLGTRVFNTTDGVSGTPKTVTATPSIGDLIVIVTAHTAHTNANAPTDNNSDGLGTYAQITSSVKASSADTMRAWVRNALIGSASSTVFSHDPLATTTGGGIAVFRISGMTLFGTAAIRQSAVQSNQASGAPAPTPVLGVAALTTNPLLGVVFNGNSAATLTPRATPAWSELFDVGYSTPTSGLEAMSINSGETGTSIVWGSNSVAAFCSLVIEFDARAAIQIVTSALTHAQEMNATDVRMPEVYDNSLLGGKRWRVMMRRRFPRRPKRLALKHKTTKFGFQPQTLSHSHSLTQPTLLEHPTISPQPLMHAQSLQQATIAGSLFGISVIGNQLVDANANVVRLKGANYSGYEFSPIQGFSPDDASGAQAGQAHGPKLSAMQTWGLNSLRITLNQAAWLGQLTWDTSANLHDADPRRRYRQDVIDQVSAATAIGFYVIVDLHWSSPANIAPMQQQLMADADNSITFWTSVANTFKGNKRVMFDLFNEPVLTYAIKSGGTLWQVLKSGGVMDYAECTSSFGLWRQVFAMAISNAVGDFRQGSVVSRAGVTATVVDFDRARQRLYYRDASGTFVAGSGLTTAVRRTRPMLDKSLLRALAPSGTPASAIDTNYNSFWRTSGALPQRLSIDISAVQAGIASPINASSPMLLAWYSELTYGFDNSRDPVGGYYNLPNDYTIEVNTAAGGGAAPTTGWVVVATVADNTFTGRQHLINTEGYNWVGFNCSAILGQALNLDCVVQVDLWNADDTVTGARVTGVGTAVTDGVMFVGDSIMAGGFEHGDVGAVATPSWGDTVNGVTGHRPPYQAMGMPIWKSSQFLADDGSGTRSVLQNFMSTCPYKYVVLALGANDAGGTASPVVPSATYVANMLALAAQVIAVGKIPIIPTITFSTNTTRNTGVQVLNAAMATALASHPEIIVGADQYAYYQANPTLIQSSDNLHPTPQGYSNLRTIVWGGWATATLYSATATIVTPSVGWQTAGMQQMVNAVRATGSQNVCLIGGVNFANDMSAWLANVPTDSLSQLAASWHPYPPQKTINAVTVANGGTGFVIGDTVDLPFPNTVYQQAQLTVSSTSVGGVITGVLITNGGRYLATTLPVNPLAQAGTSGAGVGASFNVTTYANYASVWSDPANRPVVETIAASYPVVAGEIGEHSYAGLIGSPWLTNFFQWADPRNVSILGWTWDMFGWNPNNNVLIKDVDGTPSDGYGVTFRNWALAARDYRFQRPRRARRRLLAKNRLDFFVIVRRTEFFDPALQTQTLLHAHALADSVLVQHGILTPQSLTHAHSLTNAALNFIAALATQQLVHGHSLADSGLTIAGLVPDALLHAHLLNASTVQQHLALITSDLAHLHTLASTTSAQHYLLVAEGLAHAHTLPDAVLGFILLPQSIAHSQEITPTTLVQHAVIVPADVFHNQFMADSELVVAGALIGSPLLHAHLLDTAAFLTSRFIVQHRVKLTDLTHATRLIDVTPQVRIDIDDD